MFLRVKKLAICLVLFVINYNEIYKMDFFDFNYYIYLRQKIDSERIYFLIYPNEFNLI
jgi:hypothetical protein